MPISAEALLALDIPEREQTYRTKDVILYALGLGCGLDPVHHDDLPFVYEKDLEVLPTFPTVLAPPISLQSLGTGIDWSKVVHGGQSLTLHRQLPTEGTIIGRHRIVDVIDKGDGRSALVMTSGQIIERDSGALLATVGQTLFCRGNGGFGAPRRPSPAPPILPRRAPDTAIDIATTPQAAMIYRLSGDCNRLHIDPEVAKAAGFDRPILHGLATYGIAGRALLRAVPESAGIFPRTMTTRFSAPVFPGDTLRNEIWREKDSIFFRVVVVERNRIVVGDGTLMLGR